MFKQCLADKLTMRPKYTEKESLQNVYDPHLHMQ